MGWISIKKGLPPHKKEKCIVTNNMDAVDADGQMSHIWLVSLIQKSGKEFISYTDDDIKIHGITHWHPIPLPLKKVKKINA